MCPLLLRRYVSYHLYIYRGNGEIRHTHWILYHLKGFLQYSLRTYRKQALRWLVRDRAIKPTVLLELPGPYALESPSPY